MSAAEKFFLACPGDTRRLGVLLGRNLQSGSVVALTGNLGAGKTCLTQGLAEGLNVPEEYLVVSPTFTLANEYPGRVPLFHLDVYRLTEAEFRESGLDEYFYREGVTAVEWAEKIESSLPRSYLKIELSQAVSEGRWAMVRSVGEEFDELLQKIKQDW